MSTIHQETELELIVTNRTDAADRVVALELSAVDGGPLPEWSAGAHIDLLLGPDLERQYSLCGDADDRTVWRIGVLRENDGRGGSEFVHNKLFDGSRVRVRGPRNHFELEPSPRYLFIAGGIGITPIIPMVAAAKAAGSDFEVHYGGRTTTSMAFRDQLAAFGDAVVFNPGDVNGPLDLPALLGEPRDDTLIYCCGPEALLQAVEAQTAHWPAGALHLERFAPKEFDEPVRAEAFEVELAQSGQTLTVTPDRTILDVVEEAGVQIISSCREGTCGTCETEVLSGEVEHRDSLLTPDEQAANDVMFICVSRAACPKLVLDL